MPVPDESSKERIDRELSELLQELRVALPGVQVLFAFLLTVPFSAGFRDVTSFQRLLLLISLLAAALAIVFLVAPASQHRILFRAKEKKKLLQRGNVFAIAGIVLLGVAVSSAVLLVVDFLFQWPLAAAVVAVLVGALTVLWLGQPLWYRGRQELDELFD
jgi:amino acid transporter